MSGWYREVTIGRAEWRCANSIPGAQSVTMDGIVWMPEWFADNLASQQLVYWCYKHSIMLIVSLVAAIGSVATTSASFGAGVGQIALSDVRCNGTEERLVDCPAGGVVTCSTSHREDSGVRCQAKTGYFMHLHR